MNEQDYVYIDQYLSGDMTPEEKAAFEQKLASDPNLQANLVEWQNANDQLKKTLLPDETRDHLRAKLEDHRATYFAQEKVSVRGVRRMVYSAIATAAVIASVLLFAPWNKDITKRYPPVEMSSATERGVASTTAMEKAQAYFNKSKYAEALPYLNEEVQRNPKDAFSLYHRGVAYYQTAQYDLARADLLQIYNGESLFKYEGAFYIGLSYYKQKDKKLCKEWLEKIPSTAANYLKAQRFLKEMKP
ncbi:hypothetical protein LX64_00583 [Chitinophaga skermanii]|uniref:Uncharacterized protein n=1 Tax=Chitinophaga skermanii TaxID=331697 RepID=A0A327R2D4_9BACT|nr:hypothetical protein [Chitinophaga skermanii]RAJ10976.1 hypothetical protein LX64_00583 [Chitinophaga skermanii]